MGKCLYMRKGLIHKAPQLVDPHTMLLLHGETIEDSSMYHVPISNFNVQLSTAESKFGNESLYFNGQAHLEFPQEYAKYSDQDFTIEWWEYAESDATVRFTSNLVPGGSTTIGGITIGINGTKVYSGSNGGHWDIISGKPMLDVTPNVWVHWAFVRHNSILTSYKNGNLFASYPMNGSIYQPKNNQSIGLRRYSSGKFLYHGYMDEFRISNIARWTSDFTPPTEPYKG